MAHSLLVGWHSTLIGNRTTHHIQSLFIIAALVNCCIRRNSGIEQEHLLLSWKPNEAQSSAVTKLCICPWISLESFSLIIIIIIKVFVKCKIFSLETILSTHTHAHTDRHTHTRALQLYKAKYTLLKIGSKQRIDEDIYICKMITHVHQRSWVHVRVQWIMETLK